MVVVAVVVGVGFFGIFTGCDALIYVEEVWDHFGVVKLFLALIAVLFVQFDVRFRICWDWSLIRLMLEAKSRLPVAWNRWLPHYIELRRLNRVLTGLPLFVRISHIYGFLPYNQHRKSTWGLLFYLMDFLLNLCLRGQEVYGLIMLLLPLPLKLCSKLIFLSDHIPLYKLWYFRNASFTIAEILPQQEVLQVGCHSMLGHFLAMSVMMVVVMMMSALPGLLFLCKFSGLLLGLLFLGLCYHSLQIFYFLLGDDVIFWDFEELFFFFAGVIVVKFYSGSD